MLALAFSLVGGAEASRVGRHCDGVSAAAMEDCHKASANQGERDKGSRAGNDCAAVSCVQAPAVAGPIDSFFVMPVSSSAAALVAASDADFASLTAPPDLRPPIA
ncbi:hypothetical protein C5689_17060 [Methylosinus sporium]|uniref:Uncharacterized protein n=2 Tax=Methylosinus sporium TaxID=428 RepID=A0A2U1SM43_METSR|nr:hypothetical protein C5689_17060 [Methylosinus sporium]